MAERIKLRRDTAANWLANNPVLEEGEPGVERDTGIFKVGNGTDAWVDLVGISAGGGGGGGGGQPTTQGTVSPLSVVVASSVWLSAVMIGAVLGSLAHIATQRARSSDRSLHSHSSLGSCKSSKCQSFS